MTHNLSGFLRPGERLDDLLLNGLFIIQNPGLYCFGEDAVYLSDFAAVKKGENVLDLCSGNGIIPILLSAKTEGRFFTGIELQAEAAEMAARSIEINNLQNRVRIDCNDIKNAPDFYPNGAFDVITANPPYIKGGRPNENASVNIARHEIACTLEDVINVSSKLLPKGGRLYMSHLPQRLADIFVLMRQYNIEPKTLKLVRPNPEKSPCTALVEGVKGARPQLNIFL